MRVFFSIGEQGMVFNKFLLVCGLSMAFTGCFMAKSIESDDNYQTNDVVVCQDPRSNVCTREYAPVCAIKKCMASPCSSVKKVTYANACTACADKTVRAYRPLKCE